jgi:type II secretory pathway component PulF
MALLAALVMVARTCIVGGFVAIFRDFNASLPVITQWFIASSWSMTWGMLALVVIAALVPTLLAAAPHAGWLWPLLYKIPMLGPVLRWSHLAQFGRLMDLLLGQQVPLPDALELAADGMCDGNLATACRNVADEVGHGLVLYESLADRRQFPASMIPVIEWGQRAPALPDAFRAVADMFEGRVRSQSPLLEAVLLPVTLLVIITFAGTFILAMMLPMISLISRLSSW